MGNRINWRKRDGEGGREEKVMMVIKKEEEEKGQMGRVMEGKTRG